MSLTVTITWKPGFTNERDKDATIGGGGGGFTPPPNVNEIPRKLVDEISSSRDFSVHWEV